jgi:hypothetical protein
MYIRQNGTQEFIGSTYRHAFDAARGLFFFPTTWGFE